MINTASNFLALLQNDSIKLKTASINKIEVIIDECWAEVSDHIKTLEDLFTSNITNQKDQIAIILSKLYFHLEDYENSIDWALESKSRFEYQSKSAFASTILRKILEKYIAVKKHNFFNVDNIIEIDERIQNLVLQIFHNCLDSKEFKQAIGFSLESYDLGRVS